MDEDLLYIYYLDSNCWKNLKGKMCKFRTCPGGLKCRSWGKSVASASSRLGCNLWGSAVECCQNPVSLGRGCSNLTLFLSNCLNNLKQTWSACHYSWKDSHVMLLIAKSSASCTCRLLATWHVSRWRDMEFPWSGAEPTSRMHTMQTIC